MVEEAGLEHHVEHGVGSRDRQRIAAEGRTVRARRHAGCGFRGGKTGPDRESAAERFRERHDVGGDAEALVGEQVAGAAHAGLHLVEDQQQAVARRTIGAAPKKVRRGRHPALALHRLDHDGRGLRTDRLLDRFEIAMRHLVEAVQRRPETFEILAEPVAASVPRVRPWNAPSKVTRR